MYNTQKKHLLFANSAVIYIIVSYILQKASVFKGKVLDMPKNNDETRQERFKRVASRRTNNILRQIQVLGNCSNKSSYSYTEQDIQKIFSVIDKELRETRARFANRRKNKFQL
jgi:hypothetical protein